MPLLKYPMTGIPACCARREGPRRRDSAEQRDVFTFNSGGNNDALTGGDKGGSRWRPFLEIPAERVLA
jgi:hypothetical protein